MDSKILREIAQLQKTKKPINPITEITPKDTSKSLLEKALKEPVRELLEDVLEKDTRPYYYYKPRARFTDITCQCTKCKLMCTLFAKRNGQPNRLQLELEHAFHSTGTTIIHSCGGKVKLFGHLPPKVCLY